MNDDLQNAVERLGRAERLNRYAQLWPSEAAALLDERNTLRTLLNQWLHDGRFLVANTPEYNDLLERTRVAITKVRNGEA